MVSTFSTIININPFAVKEKLKGQEVRQHQASRIDVSREYYSQNGERVKTAETSTFVMPVRVALRVRPLLPKEKLRESVNCVKVLRGSQVVIGKDRAFTFDIAHDQNCSQQQFFESGVDELVDGCFEGYNATVLAYGQTGSGKTYTMGLGIGDLDPSSSDCINEKTGVVPRICKHLFDTIGRRKHQAEFLVRVSYLEVYNEVIRDLLCSMDKNAENSLHSNTRHSLSQKPKMFITENTRTNSISVKGLRQVVVRNVQDIFEQLEIGAASRTTGSTKMNDVSSRSHAIFTIHLEQRFYSPTNKAKTLCAKFHLVDLAGSERNKRTQAKGDRFKESVRINQGLLALGNVISALGEDISKRSPRIERHIPYRQSKLTRLLQDSLGGNSRTLFVACISPADDSYGESLNTLKYANRARNIQNQPIINDEQESEIDVLHENMNSLLTAKDCDAANEQLIQDLRSQTVSDDRAQLHRVEKLYRSLKSKLEKVRYDLKQLSYVLGDEANPHIKSILEMLESTTLSANCDSQDSPSSNKMKKLLAELSSTKEELREAKADLERDETIFANKIAEFQLLQKKLQSVHADREQLRLRVIELEHENGNLFERYSHMKEVNEDLKKSLDSIPTDITKSNEEKQKIIQEGFEKELESFKSKLHQKDRKLKSFENDMDRIKEGMKLKHKTISSLQNEKNDALKRVSELEQEVLTLKKELKSKTQTTVSSLRPTTAGAKLTCKAKNTKLLSGVVQKCLESWTSQNRLERDVRKQSALSETRAQFERSLGEFELKRLRASAATEMSINDLTERLSRMESERVQLSENAIEHTTLKRKLKALAADREKTAKMRQQLTQKLKMGKFLSAEEELQEQEIKEHLEALIAEEEYKKKVIAETKKKLDTLQKARDLETLVNEELSKYLQNATSRDKTLMINIASKELVEIKLKQIDSEHKLAELELIQENKENQINQLKAELKRSGMRYSKLKQDFKQNLDQERKQILKELHNKVASTGKTYDNTTYEMDQQYIASLEKDIYYYKRDNMELRRQIVNGDSSSRIKNLERINQELKNELGNLRDYLRRYAQSSGDRSAIKPVRISRAKLSEINFDSKSNIQDRNPISRTPPRKSLNNSYYPGSELSRTPVGEFSDQVEGNTYADAMAKAWSQARKKQQEV